MTDLRRRMRRYRQVAKRVPGARRLYLKVLGTWERFEDRVLSHVHYDDLPSRLALQLGYDMLLDREPDETARRAYFPQLKVGNLENRDLVQLILGSAEFEIRGFQSLIPSIHSARCRFVRSLPRAARIVDLGGSSLSDRRGAMVAMGYPYDFERLTVVDLPADERHPLYRPEVAPDVFETEYGPVEYHYHSMADLSEFPDGSIDLVYSGQSIEHVTTDEGEAVCREVWRILRPGGHFAIDTPNGRVTRLQQDEFIDPDHKVEYDWAGLSKLVTSAGFDIEWSKGINYAGRPVRLGQVDLDIVSRNSGLFDEIEDCYILALVAVKPVEGRG